jgi:hypothetical protein
LKTLGERLRGLPDDVPKRHVFVLYNNNRWMSDMKQLKSCGSFEVILLDLTQNK